MCITLQVISGFRREADNCALLGFYAATFRNKEGSDRFPETSVWNFHNKLHNNSEEGMSDLLHGGGLKSRKACLLLQ
jgi:hypothetical protein